MGDTPRLTVGIPTFNRSSWLREAISSVLSQSFTDLRLIVSDNASDDGTPFVVRAVEDPRLEYRRHRSNLGSIANLNTLIALTRTEFLMLLADDDLLYPGHLEASIRALDRFPSAGMVHSAFALIDDGSTVLGRRAPLRREAATEVLEPGEQALRRLMTARWPICFSSVVYRTEAIVEAGGIPDGGPFADLQLWMRMTRDWDIAYLPSTLTGFRLHARSVSASVAGELDPDGLTRRHAQMRYEQRVRFLDDNELPHASSLRSLVELEYLLETGRAGLPTREVARRLLALARRSPRGLLRGRLWRFVLARLGGSRARAAIAAARPRSRRPSGHRVPPRPGPESWIGAGEHRR